MAKPRFYHAQLTGDESTVSLTTEEVRHVGAARRLAEGDQILLMNGRGGVAEAEIRVLDKRRCEVALLAWEQSALPKQRRSIATAVPKPDRQRFMVEALVQLGVTELVPLNCQRSITQGDHKSLSKWPRYAIEAIKQSGNPWLPEIRHGTDLHTLLEQSKSGGAVTRLFADVDSQGDIQFDANAAERLLLIGPEGGFTDAEREDLLSNGFAPLRLAGPILRTEVAAIVGAARLLHASEADD